MALGSILFNPLKTGSLMSTDQSTQLLVLINGFQISQAISVAATLGIPDLLRDGALPCHALSAATRTHSLSLYRLLSALAAIGILNEQANRMFQLTSSGESLRSDISSSKNAWARLFGRPMYYQAWSGLLDSLRTGEPAFNKVHGMSVWEFRAQRPDETAAFDWAMAAIADQIADAVLSMSDLSRYSSVVDVGGGQGAFIARILSTHDAWDTFRPASCNCAS
jgi:O-methyltransferase domain/Dimerisation domain